MKPFFVTGLPRTRTAWCANWLTTDHSLCLHDPLVNELPKVVRQAVGLSGPEVFKLYKDYKTSPWLVLVRDSEVCKRSFQQVVQQEIAGLDEFWSQRVADLQALKDESNVLWLHVDLLDVEESAKAVWQHLLGDIPFDLLRWQMLVDLNVTQNFDKRKEKLWPLLQQQC